MLDESQIHQSPVLFDVLPGRIELGVARVIDTPEATHLRYRVRA